VEEASRLKTGTHHLLQTPGSEPREQDGNVQKVWSYSQAEHCKPDGFWHPFMIKDGPMRSRALATSSGALPTCALTAKICTSDQSIVREVAIVSHGAAAVSVQVQLQTSGTNCATLCYMAGRVSSACFALPLPQYLSELDTPPPFFGSELFFRFVLEGLAFCKQLVINARQYHSSVHGLAGRAPVSEGAWWSGGPLFDVQTGKVMVSAAATLPYLLTTTLLMADVSASMVR
jgi:hypothetical protein